MTEKITIEKRVLEKLGIGSQGAPGPAVAAGSVGQVLFSDGVTGVSSAKFLYDSVTGAMTLSPVWNNAGTTFDVFKAVVTDTAYSANSRVVEIATGGGVSIFRVSRAGDLSALNSLQINNGGSGYWNSSGLNVRDVSFVGWSATGNASAGADVKLYRDSAGYLALRNGLNNQTFRVYGAIVDTANYVRGFISSGNGDVTFGGEAAGTYIRPNVKLTGQILYFDTAGSTRWFMNNAGMFGAATDNAYDIGGSGGSRPRNAYIGSSLYVNSTGTNGIAANGVPALTIYGPTGLPAYAGELRFQSLDGTSTSGQIQMYSVGLSFATGTSSLTSRWIVDRNAGHFFAAADNAYDIGASNSNRPRSLYVASGVYSEAGGFDLFSAITGTYGLFRVGTQTEVRAGTSVLLKAGGVNGLGVLPGPQIYAYAPVTGTADAVEFQRGLNPQGLRVYNTYTDSGNYERAYLRWASVNFDIGTEALGTGVARNIRLISGNDLYFGTPNGNSTNLTTAAFNINILGQLNHVFGFNKFEMRNGVNAQTFNVYNTFTDSANYERGFFRFTSSFLEIGTENAGTGSSRNMRLKAPAGASIYFQANGADKWYMDNTTFGAVTDNATDIGTAAGARPRTIYAGTSVIGGNAVIGSVGSDGLVTTINGGYLSLNAAGGRVVAAAPFYVSSGLFHNTSGITFGTNMAGGGGNRWTMTSAGDFLPAADNTYVIGSPILRPKEVVAGTSGFTLWNAYTDGANYERGSLLWSGSELMLWANRAGTGLARNLTLRTEGSAGIQFATAGLTRWIIDANGHLNPNSPNTFDIGSGASVRSIYAGTSIVSNGLVQSSTANGVAAYFSLLQAGVQGWSIGMKASSGTLIFNPGSSQGGADLLSLNPTGQLTLKTAFLGDTANDYSLDIGGSWMRIGDGPAAATFANGVGIKFLDAGIAHWSVGMAPTSSNFVIALTSANASALFPVGYSLPFTLTPSGALTLLGSVTAAGVVSSGNVSIAAGAALQLSDVFLYRDGAGLLAQRNGTNPQSQLLYNTYTDAANYERAFTRWGSNLFDIGTEAAGTGAARAVRIMSALDFSVYSQGVQRLLVTGSAVVVNHLFMFSSDNVNDIGQPTVNRPRHIYAAGDVRSAGLIVGANEIRLNNGAAYSRVAALDGAGGMGGGYNVNNPTTGIVETPVTGFYAGYAYKQDGSVNFYGGSGATAGGAITPLLKITSAGTLPGTGDAYSLGSTSARWAEVTTKQVTFNSATALVVENSGVLAQRGGAQAQTFNVYSTYTDGANYARTAMYYSGGYGFLETQAAGTGSLSGLVLSGATLYLRTGTTDRWCVSGSGHFNPVADNTYDIGGVAIRPRDIYATRNIQTSGGQITVGVHGTSGLQLINDGTVGTLDAQNLTFRTNSSARWKIDATTGTLYPAANNSTDLGQPGNGMRSVYVQAGGAGYYAIKAYTDASNYERADMYWAGFDFCIGTRSAGTGAQHDLVFMTQGNVTTRFTANTVEPQTDGALILGTVTKKFHSAHLVGANGLNVYNTVTDASNYERGVLNFQASVLTLEAQASGTGTLRFVNIKGAGVNMWANGVNGWQFGNGGHLYAQTDNTFNIGQPGGSRPANVYVGSGLHLANAAYLNAKTNAGNNTRILGINSGDVLYMGGVDQYLAGGLLYTNNGVNQMQIQADGQMHLFVPGAGATLQTALLVQSNSGAATKVLQQTGPKLAVTQITGGDNNENFPGALMLITPSIFSGGVSHRGSEIYFVGTRATTAQLGSSNRVALGVNDILGRLTFGGDDGVTLRSMGGYIQADATENWSSTAHGGSISFFTTTNGTTTPTGRWTFAHDGTFAPVPDLTLDIGSAGARVRNIYAGNIVLNGAGSNYLTGGNTYTQSVFPNADNLYGLGAPTNRYTGLTTSQTGLQVYNSFTDGANYELGYLRYAGNTLQLGTSAAGTGIARSIMFVTAGTGRWLIDSTGHLYPSNADATLDIGVAGLRPRDINLGRNLVAAGSVVATSLLQGSYANLAGTTVAAGVASTGIFFGGPTIAHGNLAWLPNERELLLTGTNTATGTVNVYGANLALRDGNSIRVYNAFTDLANFERAYTRWAGNIFEIGTEALGTGVARKLRLKAAVGREISFNVGGVDIWEFQTNGTLLAKTDSAYDIGDLAGAGRARDVFIGRDLRVWGEVQFPMQADWNTRSVAKFSLYSAGVNGPNGVSTMQGAYFPHGGGGYGFQIAGRLNNAYYRTEENGVFGSWVQFSYASLLETLTNKTIYSPIFQNTIEHRNGVTAQQYNMYGTYTDSANYERLELAGGTTFGIWTRSAGTGIARALAIGTLGAAPLNFLQNGVTTWFMTNSGHFLANADNTYDIGASSANRPRNVYVGSSVVTPALTVTGGVISRDGGGPVTFVRAAGYASLALTDTTATVLSRWTASATALHQWTNASGGSVYWQIDNSGHFGAGIDNTYDIGAAAANRPRDLNVGRNINVGTGQVTAPAFVTTDTTVASLPGPAGTRGQRRHVTDSTVAAAGNFGATVAGGGTNVVPVFSTGTAWIIA